MQKLHSTLAGRIAAILLFSFAGTFGLRADVSKYTLTHEPGSDAWGYRNGYKGEWLTPKEYTVNSQSSFKNGLVVVQRLDKLWNVLNENFEPVLPTWTKSNLTVVAPFILQRAENVDYLYDMNGNRVAYAMQITPFVEKKYGAHKWQSSRFPDYSEHLVGFCVKVNYNGQTAYTFLTPELKPLSKFYVSLKPIDYRHGMVKYYDGKESIITDIDGNILDRFPGESSLTSIEYFSDNDVQMPFETLYDGYLPALAMPYTDTYKGKASGQSIGKEIFKQSGFKYLSDLPKKKRKDIYAFFNDPANVAEYKAKVLTPLNAYLARTANVGRPMANQMLKTRLISGSNGYFFSADGVNIKSGTEYYDEVEAYADSTVFIGRKGNVAHLLRRDGVRSVENQVFSDIMPAGKDAKYFIAQPANSTGVQLLTKSGNNVGADTYDDIIYKNTPAGDVFYFVKGNKWRAWLAGNKSGTPKMRYYDYVGQPDANGNVEVKFNGFSGSYNLKDDTEKDPARTLFMTAYDNDSWSGARRIKIYKQVIALDRQLNAGLTGAAYNNIGSIYEDAGDQDTAFSYYEMAKDAGNEKGESNYKRIRNARRLDRIARVAGAISGAISNTMAAMGGGGVGSESFSGYNSGYGDVNSLSSSSASSGGGYSASFYQEQYTNWERRAQQAYESLTLLGTRVQRGGKDTAGSTGRGMSGSNYTRQKKCLRDAQREMQTIRTKARKDGVTIRQSHWETVTVSY